jgi:hypothetical protein
MAATRPSGSDGEHVMGFCTKQTFMTLSPQ